MSVPKHAIPRADEQSKAFFRSVLPKDPRVHVRSMFGNVAAFAQGQMFAGLLGSAVFVRLPTPERAALLKEPGAAIFEPMKGRRMNEYVTLPKAWNEQPEKVRRWVSTSLNLVGNLPEKATKGARK